MSSRFFVETPITSGRAVLIDQEAHHLAHVMRVAVGEEITLFDGEGAEFDARVVKIGRSSVDVQVLARHEVNRELDFPLVLGVAIPKGDRQKWLVEKATELGVTQLVPLKTERGVAQPVEQAIERLRRSVIEASKQCGRNRLLEVAPPQTLADYIATAPAESLRYLAHPSGENDSKSSNPIAAEGGVFLAVGPEGGFTEDEVAQAARQGWQIVGLGSRILRVETAAMALCSRWSM